MVSNKSIAAFLFLTCYLLEKKTFKNRSGRSDIVINFHAFFLEKKSCIKFFLLKHIGVDDVCVHLCQLTRCYLSAGIMNEQSRRQRTERSDKNSSIAHRRGRNVELYALERQKVENHLAIFLRFLFE